MATATKTAAEAAIEQLQHRKGCPETRTVTDPDGSIHEVSGLEPYVVERGVTAGLANASDQRIRGDKVSVIRCNVCAEQVVLDDGGAANESFRASMKKGDG